MITILKGDTSADISVVLAEGFDYSASTVVVEYQGARKCFASCKAGDVLTFCFTAEETSPMAFGLHPISVRIVRHDGSIVSVPPPATAIRVTDDPREVHVDGVIAVDVKGGLFGIEDLPERWTEEDVVAKLREILRRGGALLCALFLTIPCFGASVSTAPKGKIYNDAPVVTNVTFDGLATTDDVAQAIAGMSTITTNDVCNIVTNEVTVGFTEWRFSCDVPEIQAALDASDIRVIYVDHERFYALSEVPSEIAGSWTTSSEGSPLKHSEDDDQTELIFGYSKIEAGGGAIESATVNITRERITRNALGLARQKDIEPLPTYEEVTNTARDVSNTFWDDKNSVLWKIAFKDGEPMFLPLTNENVSVTGGVE